MVLQPEIFNYIEDDSTVFEQSPLTTLAKQNEVMSFLHRGYWQCMDTAREKAILEKQIASGAAPWIKW
jgi:glucose-1-phosphate cytidylyltransferase